MPDERSGRWKRMPDGVEKRRAFLEEVHCAERRSTPEPSARPRRSCAIVGLAIALAAILVVLALTCLR